MSTIYSIIGSSQILKDELLQDVLNEVLKQTVDLISSCNDILLAVHLQVHDLARPRSRQLQLGRNAGMGRVVRALEQSVPYREAEA